MTRSSDVTERRLSTLFDGQRHDAGTSRDGSTLVSYLIPTTLDRHAWWNRLAEYLTDSFPAGASECVFLGTQDADFDSRAASFAAGVVEALSSLPGVEEKARNVRFLSTPDSEFNVGRSRNLLLQAARGKIVIYRDADTVLLHDRFTSFAVNQLVESRYGMLGFPSSIDGVHHKPHPTTRTVADPESAYRRITSNVGGMTTAALKSALLAVGGWNVEAKKWGEHLSICNKLSQGRDV